MTRQALFAVAMVLAMVGAPLTGAVAAADSTADAGNLSVSVAQDDNGEVTVSVTKNDTGVANASVLVETVDDNDTYAGAGNYTTGDGGEAELPVPGENVTVDVTAEADNETATTTAELVTVAGNETDSFGQRVSAYVHALQNNEDVTGLGPYVAAFITANNPGNAPDHAGPPEDRGTDGDEGKTAAASDEDGERGPPEGAGPPADAGPPEDGDDTDGDADNGDDGTDEDGEADEEETEAEDDGEDEDGDDERGPPEGAGPPGHVDR